mgnify:FL=1
MVLLGDRLDQLAHASSVSRSTLRIMKQNTAIALGTVFALIVAVLLGALGLAGGMFIHEASVLLVILNALRLSGKKKEGISTHDDHQSLVRV